MSRWNAVTTILIVGEGRTEEAFLKHIKSLFVPRGCDLRLDIKQARGKGAGHVVEQAIRIAQNAKYYRVAALLDTDEGWSPSVEKKARQKKIQILKSDPRFEALMLRLLGHNPVGNSADMKAQLSPFVSDDATVSENYQQHFSQAVILQGRRSEATIDSLLRLLNC